MLHPVLQKPLALSIALCLGLSGCQVFDKSETWETVMKVRPGQSVRDPDPSHAYAARLHDALVSRGVEHKVVTYQYRYTTRLRDEAVGTRTAVIYRDTSSGTHQWWLKDERLNKPVWLPNGEINRQVSFYLRRKAEVIEQKNYPGNAGSSKAMVAFKKPAQSLRPAAPERAVVKVVPVKKAPAPVVVKKPEPTPKPVVKVKPAPVRIAAKPAPAPKPRKPEPTPFFKVAPARVIEKPVAKQQPAAKVVVKKKPIAKLKPRSAVKPRVAAKPAPVVKPAPVAATKPKPAAVMKLAPVAAKPTPVAAKPAPVAPKAATIARETDILAPIASRSTSTWNPPSVLDRAQQPPETAPRDRYLERLFRSRHGSDYNVFSGSDRRKMAELQKSESGGE